ncbi:MAG: hypothetical protein KDJ65_33760 [Anaerolineae bacterium]|nr:hypothetical protein [Anaerolineae bacterium]
MKGVILGGEGRIFAGEGVISDGQGHIFDEEEDISNGKGHILIGEGYSADGQLPQQTMKRQLPPLSKTRHSLPKKPTIQLSNQPIFAHIVCCPIVKI